MGLQPSAQSPALAKLVQQGTNLFAGGDLEGAERVCQQAIALDPSNFDALFLLGWIARERGRPVQSVGWLKQACEVRADVPLLQVALGDALMQCNDARRALQCYQQALALDDDNVQAYAGVATALQQQQHWEAAAEAYREVFARVPDCAELYYNAALVSDALHRFDDAIEHCRQAVSVKPEYGAAWLKLGRLLRRLAQTDEALRVFQEASALPEVAAEAYEDLGSLLQELGHRDTALKCLRRAVELAPESGTAWCNLGVCCREMGDLDGAMEYFRRAHELAQEDAGILTHLVTALQDSCAWGELEAMAGLLHDRIERALARGGAMPLTPFMTLSMPMSPARQQQIAHHFSECVVKPAVAGVAPICRQPRSGGRIRVGYVSPNFRNHPTSHLMVRLFELHDHERFEIFVYSHGPDDNSNYRRRIAEASDHFVDLHRASSAEIAERIAADGIDILVDRAGYTKGARSEVFALRPAPVQVNYIGFPGSLGSDAIDYIITDAVVTPPGAERWLSEQPVYMPDTYLVTDQDQVVAAETPSRGDCGLPDSGFVFCSFNNSFKIEPSMFAVWMRLLHQVPGSVLWLLQTSASAEVALREAAAAAGVEPARLVFAPRQPKDRHLARHRLADLFLDTRYYNAHTTAVDALYMGLPMVTCAGETFASRVGASVLTAAGLPDTIVYNLDAYETLALQLARDPERLHQLRLRLADVAERPLFDTLAYTRHLERAYIRMWRRHLDGSRPTPIRVPVAD